MFDLDTPSPQINVGCEGASEPLVCLWADETTSTGQSRRRCTSATATRSSPRASATTTTQTRHR